MVNKRSLAAQKDHEEWLFRRGLTLAQIKKRKKNFTLQTIPFPNLKIESNIPLGNGFANSGFVNTPMSNRFKEKPEVRKEIEAKASRIAPAFNKSGYSYISNKEDAKYIGRK